MKKATSIHHIAEYVGVSAATVSRIINNDTRISQETTDKVRAAMKDLGYTPRPRSKRPGPHKKVSDKFKKILLITGSLQSNRAIPIYAKFYKGLEERAKQAGVKLSYAIKNNSLSLEGIDGLILFGQQLDNSGLGDLPCIKAMGSASIEQPLDHITYNSRAIGELAAYHLKQKGVQNAIIIQTKENAAYKPIRVTAFEQHFSQNGGTSTLFNEDILITIGNMQQINQTNFKKLLPLIHEHKDSSIGIFSLDDCFLPSLYAILREAGIEPEKDLPIVSSDNTEEYLNLLSPAPPSIDINAYTIGTRAIDQILWRMQNPHDPKVEIQLMPELAMPVSQ